MQVSRISSNSFYRYVLISLSQVKLHEKKNEQNEKLLLNWEEASMQLIPNVSIKIFSQAVYFYILTIDHQ